MEKTTPLPPPSAGLLPSSLSHLAELAGQIDFVHEEAAQKYAVDPRDRFVGGRVPVFLPRTTQEVSKLVAACHAHGTKIIPHGGGTGVVAGQLVFETENTILISLEKMNKVRALSVQDQVITVEAGCILADVQAQAHQAGMLFPLAMASEASAMIGGNLATNCGGIQVLRYGNARDLCLGIEAVLPDGSILDDLTPLRKNNTGYDLRHLLIGSEGTLGIITAASLVLKPQDKETLTAFCAVSSPANALQLLGDIRAELGEIVTAFELMCDFGFEVLGRHFPEERFPLSRRCKWYVLMELGGPTGLQERFMEFCAPLMERKLMERELMEGGLIEDAILAVSGAQRDALWRLRELTPEANRLNGAICNSDTSVPLSAIPSFIERTYHEIEKIDPALTINCYGHVGDGNIHFNVFPPAGRSKKDIIANDQALIDAIRTAINLVTVEFCGSISAEHGIGRLKLDDLERFGDPVRLSLQKTLKQAIDPKNIMNPGALLAP